jgi:tetratricopeptide (TPR) repeat protein
MIFATSAMKKAPSLLALSGLILALFPASAPTAPQGRPQRPALIRDTDAAEGKEEPTVEKEKPYDPLMAEKTLKIGDFYLKRKNYAAAAERYIEALQYQPDMVDAFDALGKAYEKMGDWAKATAVYKDFISKNPDSPKIPDFRAKLARLEKKS